MKFGVLGYGSIGRRHADNLRRMGHDVLWYDPAAAVGAARRAAVLDQAHAIVIATPTDRHADDLDEAIATRKPVFVEKPIAADVVRVEAALREAQAKNVPVMVGYNLRFHPCVQRARQWLGSGMIGDPIWAQLTCAQFNDRPAYLRDGVVLNWSHEIDLALHLLGPASVVNASVRERGTGEDIADIQLLHTNGCRSSVHLDYVTMPEIRLTGVVGAKGIMTIDIAKRGIWLSHRDTAWWPGGKFDDDYVTEMLAFIDRIDGRQTIGATGQDGLEALRICVAARRLAGLT